MKFIYIIFLLFLVPSVNAINYDVFFSDTLDSDYGQVQANNTRWGDSATSRWEYHEFPNSDTDALTSLNAFPPTGYTFYGEMQYADTCNANVRADMRLVSPYGTVFDTEDMEVSNIFGGRFSVSVAVGNNDAKYNGSYQLVICDTSNGGFNCAYSGLTGVTSTIWSTNTLNFHSDFTGHSIGFEEIDQVWFEVYPYYPGCSGFWQTRISMANITLSRNVDAPAYQKVYDGTLDQNLEGANVSWSGADTISQLTDSQGLAFEAPTYITNGSYTLTITKDGYYPFSTTRDMQSCRVDISTIDTYIEYSENCGLGTVTLYQIPDSQIIYNFEVVNIQNQPINNSYIRLKQTQFPYSSVTGRTDATGLVDIILEPESTYSYEVGEDTDFYTVQTGSLSTNVSNTTRKFVLTEFGCSNPSLISPSEDAYIISITNFTDSYTQTFRYEMETTAYLQSFEWFLNDKTYAFNYPEITITFTEQGDKWVTVYSRQSGCTLGYTWYLHLDNTGIIPEEIRNLTTTEQHSKESFLREIEVFVPYFFVLICLFSIVAMFQRIGRKPSFKRDR